MAQKFHLSFTKKLEVVELLTQYCDKFDGNSYYKPGWDDARIAKEAGGGANARHVRTIRDEVFGTLGRTPPPDATLLARVEDLEKRVADLERRTAGSILVGADKGGRLI